MDPPQGEEVSYTKQCADDKIMTNPNKGLENLTKSDCIYARNIKTFTICVDCVKKQQSLLNDEN